MKPKLFLDFDGCIVDTIGSITSLYNEDYCAYNDFRYVHPSKVATWDFTECKCASKDAINQYFNTPRFFKRLRFMPHAESMIILLSYQFQISIVSHGYSPNLKLKKDWVAKNLPDSISFIGVNFKNFSDKSCVDMQNGIFIDDSTKNLKSSNAEYKIIYGKKFPWNEDDNDYIRCLDWISLYQEIIKIAGKETAIEYN